MFIYGIYNKYNYKQGLNMKKICYIVCYKDTNYVRTASILAGLEALTNVEVEVIRNTKKSFMRFPEVFLKVFKSRLRVRPDTYIVGFRGHEIFWAIYPFMFGREIVFDEFISTYDWFTHEHSKVREGSLAAKLILSYMRKIAKYSDYVISDTNLHARRIAALYGGDEKKYKSIYVGTDESLFFERKRKKENKKFTVFFYGNMLPLHGTEIILESIKIVAKQLDSKLVKFQLIGGRSNKAMLETVGNYLHKNNLRPYVNHVEWVEYEELPLYISDADLCLGGPFGGTGQSGRVITGKTYQFLAMGKPTVIGRIDEDDGFRDKKNCLLVNQADSLGLANAILWANNNKKSLDAIGGHATILYKSRFSSNAIGAQLAELFE